MSVYVDKVALLCEGGKLERCITRTPQGEPMFYDKHHLSLPFAQWLGQRVGERYPQLVEPKRVVRPDAP